MNRKISFRLKFCNTQLETGHYHILNMKRVPFIESFILHFPYCIWSRNEWWLRTEWDYFFWWMNAWTS